jgi:hypothetical protein
LRIVNLPHLVPPPSDPPPGTTIVERLGQADTARFEAGLYLSAYMLWPNDEERRDQWMLALEPLRRRLADEPVDVDPGLHRFGGLAMLAEAALEKLENEAMDIQRRIWLRVADILQTIVDISHDPRTRDARGGASVDKAIELLETAQALPSRGSLASSWRNKRDVAHFVTAACLLCLRANQVAPQLAISPLDVVLIAPDLVLSAGLAFQNFGLGFVPHGQKISLLNPQNVWRVPPECGIDASPLIVRKLTDAQIQFLVGRRARNRKG